MNMIIKDGLTFTIFGRMFQSRSGYAIMNEDFKIESISKIFLEKVGMGDV